MPVISDNNGTIAVSLSNGEFSGQADQETSKNITVEVEGLTSVSTAIAATSDKEIYLYLQHAED